MKIDSKHIRDIAADYKAALIEEYNAYKRAGRDDEAGEVAGILKYHYDHDVDASGEKKVTKKAESPEPEPAQERAVPDAAETETPERTEPPVRRGPGRPRKTE